MLIKTYKKRIFISISGMLLVILSMVCLTSFYVSRSIMKTGFTDTKIQQLHVINQQINYSCEQANDVLNLMAHDADIANAVKEIDRGTMSSVFVHAAQKLQNLIISRKTAYLYFKKVYIVSSKYILSENGIEANLTTEAEAVTKNPYMSKLLTDEQFRQYVLSNDSDVFNENILITHINETSFIVGILDFKRLLGEKQERMLYVFDSSNDLIFKDNESAERMEYVKENLEIFWRTTTEKTNAAAAKYLPVALSGSGNSFKYLMLVDVELLDKALMTPLLKLVLLAGVVFFIWLAVLYFSAAFVVRPITLLNKVAAGIRDSSDTGELDGFITRMEKTKRMRVKVYLYYCLILVPLIVVTAASYLIFKDTIMEEIQLTYSRSVEQVAESLEKRFEGYMSLSRQVCFDKALKDVLVLQSANPKTDDENTLKASFNNILYRNGVLSQAVTYIKLYDALGNLCFSTYTSQDTEQLEPAVLEKLEAPFSYSVFNMSKTEEGKGSIYFIIRNHEYSAGQNLLNILGYLEMGVSGFFDSKLTVTQFTPYSMRYIYSKSDWSLISTASSAPYRHLVEGMAQGNLISEDSPKIVQLDTGKAMIASRRIQGTDWMLVYMFPMEGLMKENLKILYYNIYSLCILLFLLMLLSGFFTVNMVGPIARLQKYFSLASPGSIDLPVPQNIENEVGALALSFRGLLKRINGLTEQIKRKEKERFELERRRNELQIVVLQSQMNPHLLYNIFTSMKFLLIAEKKDELQQMIEATGAFLRNSLVSGEYQVKLSKEIAYVKSYVKIQQIRHNERIEANWHMEDTGLMDLLVPKYFLQPIIENSIVHGMHRSKVLVIDVGIHADDETNKLEIVVTDNGIGMPQEKLDEIHAVLSGGNPSVHVGLPNINERIQLNYGGRYGLKIESESGHWTRVTVMLPIQKGGENDV